MIVHDGGPDVIVIGGGFAGLSAATALVEAGATVEVIEARPALGGRATAYRDPVTGERIDNGHHALAGCYTETLRFLARIGALSRLHRPSTLRVPMIDENGRPTVFALPPLPAPLHLLAGIFAWDALTPGERLGALRIGRAMRAPVPPRDAGAHVTVRQWLEGRRQSPRLCRLLWEPLALATLNQSIDEAGVRPFLAVVSRMFGSDPDASALLMAASPLDELYALPARAFLERAGSIVRTGAPARVLVGGGRVTGVRVRDEVRPARVVVSAVPWFALGDLFETPPPELRAILDDAEALGSQPIVTVNLWFDERPLREPMIGLPGRTFQWIFDKRSLVGDSQAHLSLTCSGAAAICDASNDAIVAIAVRELGEAIPAFARATLRRATVVRERRATFALGPGAPSRPGTRTPLGGFVLAGDWIETGLPATIESAVLSGHRAAGAVLGMLA